MDGVYDAELEFDDATEVLARKKRLLIEAIRTFVKKTRHALRETDGMIDVTPLEIDDMKAVVDRNFDDYKDETVDLHERLQSLYEAVERRIALVHEEETYSMVVKSAKKRDGTTS